MYSMETHIFIMDRAKCLFTSFVDKECQSWLDQKNVRFIILQQLERIREAMGTFNW